MDVVPRDGVAIDVESLATKYPIVKNMMYYQIIRADGSSKNYKIFSEMLDDFDRQDVIDLHRALVQFVLLSIVDARAELDYNKLLKLMQFLLGIDDVYQPIRSSLLTREILLEVKDAFVVIAKKESHRGIPLTFLKTDKPQASVFVSRSNDNRGAYNGFKRNPKLKPTKFNNENNNSDASGNFLANSDIKTSIALSFTNVHVMKLTSLLNEKFGSSAHANMAGKALSSSPNDDEEGPYVRDGSVHQLLACRPVMTPLFENILLCHKESDDDKSLVKAEYRSMASTTCEIMWILNIMKDLNEESFISVNLNCDIKIAIQIASNPVMHEKTKHFDIDVYLVREKVSYSTANTQFSLLALKLALLSTQVSNAYLIALEEMNLKWQLALLSMRTRRFFQKTSRNITIIGASYSAQLYMESSKVECFNYHKMGHFAMECRGPRNQDNRNMNQDSSKRTVNVEETSSKAMVAIDEAGFDLSYMGR
ncbi:ribonuclease H-like domain-containing protein [Tanacetum coccineum]